MAPLNRCLVYLCIFALHCACIYGSPLFFRGRPRGGMLGVPVLKEKVSLPREQWFTQILDHFDDSNSQTWQQRYFVNDTFYHPGGPVFLMIGGEGTASPIWMVTGQWIKYAQIYQAVCIQLEHRFYGKSHPTKDMSTSNLRFLSSEQALSDIANFHSYITKKMNLQGHKWITFGGSYPGSLSAWFRLKYPHLVQGAIATSAPVQAVINFKEYLGVVRNSLGTTGSSCNSNIKSATSKIMTMMQSASGREKLKALLNLCDDIDITNKNDLANLYQNLAGNFEGVVQYNKDNRAFEGGVGTNITIDTLCGIMDDVSIADPLEKYASVNKLIMKTYDQKCLDFKYDKMIKEMQLTDWSSSAAEGGRQWTYQTCTEFGFFQSSDLVDQPFGNGFNVEFFIQQCADIYGPQFTKDLLIKGVNSTNRNYGGFGLKVSRVFFVNGSIDPWHALGILTSLSPSSPAFFINGTAHCANMYPDSPDDPPQLKEARMQVQKMICQWLTNPSCSLKD